MSSFNCEHCGTAILDTPGGEYVTECEHYPKEKGTTITLEDVKIAFDALQRADKESNKPYRMILL